MRKLVIFAIICISICVNADNLLVNGNFRLPMRDNKIIGWTMNDEFAKQDVRIVEINGKSCLQVETIEPTKRKGVLSQRVKLMPNTDYVFTVYLKRDTVVYATYVSVNIPQGKKKVLKNEKVFRSNKWTPMSFVFNTKSASSATIAISIVNSGSKPWITTSKKLWIRDATLSQISPAKNINISNIKSGENIFNVNIRETAPYYVWAKVYLPGENSFSIKCDNEKRVFRGYTLNKWYWVRPILPDFILNAGKSNIKFTVNGKGVKVKQLLLTMDQFYRPPGADELLPPIPGQHDGGIPPVKVEHAKLALKVDKNLPNGKWGITQGVPFPKGALPKAANAVIKDRPFQASAISKWPDGSVRWLLLSTLVSSEESLELDYGSKVRAETSEKADGMLKRQFNGGYLVSTGKIKFNVNPDPKALITNLQNKSLTVFFNNQVPTSKPSIKVEESGPVRTVLKISGKYNEAFSYVLRVFAYARADNIELEHQLINSGSKATKALDCGLKIIGDFKTAGFMPSSKTVASPVPVKMSTLVKSPKEKYNSYPYEISAQGKSLQKGERAKGLVNLDSKTLITVQGFWRNSPSEIAIEPKQAIIKLYLGDILFDSGMSKSRRLLLGISANDASRKVFLAHPLLLASSEWYCNTRAFYAWPLSAAEAKSPLYEKSVDGVIKYWQKKEDLALRKEQNRNMLYDGETPYVGVQHENLETAIGEGVMTQFFRTGNRDYYDYGARIISHFADVDINQADNSFKGRVRRHGPFIRNLKTHIANGHSWYGGASLYGLFSGNRAILDMAQAVGEYHAYRIPPKNPRIFIHFWRRPAWRLLATLHAWTVCNDDRLLKPAKDIVKLTRSQRDHVVTLWPYMYGVGMKGLRIYYEITGDPAVRELYLQMVDAYMYLLPRPSEFKKSPGLLLSDFPLDRSCVFYNLTAQSDWMAKRVKYVPYLAPDMNIQLQYGINDPTFLWGTADLLRAIKQDKIKMARQGVMTPRVLMNFSAAKSPSEKITGPLVVFQVNEREDRDFSLTLYSCLHTFNRYAHKLNYLALLYAPDGTLVKAEPFISSGMNQYKIAVPKDGKRGIYTLIVSSENPWKWTLEYLPYKLKAGKHSLTVTPIYTSIIMDAFCFVPFGAFNPDSPDAVLIEAENGKMDKNYTKVPRRHAGGKSAVIRVSGNTSLSYTFSIPKTGTYIFHSKLSTIAPDGLRISVDGSKPVNCVQTHDMSHAAYPTWLLKSSLGPDSIIPDWGFKRTRYSKYMAFDSTKLKPSPAFGNAAKYLDK